MIDTQNKPKEIGRSPCKIPCYTGLNKILHYSKNF